MKNLMTTQLNGVGHLIVTLFVYACITLLLFFGKVGVDVFYVVSGPIILFWFSTALGARLAPSGKDTTSGSGI